MTEIIFASATKDAKNTSSILNCYFAWWIYTLVHETIYIKAQAAFWTAILHDEFTLWYTKIFT